MLKKTERHYIYAFIALLVLVGNLVVPLFLRDTARATSYYVTITSPTSSSSVSSSSILVTGTATPGETVEILVNGVVNGTTVSDSYYPTAGEWNYTISGQASGSKTITARLKKEALFYADTGVVNSSRYLDGETATTTVTTLDAGSGADTAIPVPHAQDMAWLGDNSKAYILSKAGGSRVVAEVMKPATKQVTYAFELDADLSGGNPHGFSGQAMPGMSLSADDAYLYIPAVTGAGQAVIYVVDTTIDEVVDTVNLGLTDPAQLIDSLYNAANDSYAILALDDVSGTPTPKLVTVDMGGRTVLATHTLGYLYDQLLPSGGTTTVYASSFDNSSVDELNLMTGSVSHTAHIATGPHVMTRSNDGQNLYVLRALDGGDSISRSSAYAVTTLATSSWTVTGNATTTCDTAGIADIGGEGLYCVDGPNQLQNLLTSDTVTLDGSLSLSAVTYRMQLSPDGATLYNTASSNAAITLSSGAVSYMTPQALPGVGSAISVDGATQYLSIPAKNQVKVVNTTSGSVTATVTVGKQPTGLALSPDGTKLFVANTYDKSISVITTSNNTVAATYTLDERPMGLVVSPDGATLYTSFSEAGEVAKLVASSGAVSAVQTVGSHPQSLALGSSGAQLYVANAGADTVTVISTSGFSVADTWTVGLGPSALAVDAAHSRLFVATDGVADPEYPDVPPYQTHNPELQTVSLTDGTITHTDAMPGYTSGLQVMSSGRVAVAGEAGVGFYNPTTQLLSTYGSAGYGFGTTSAAVAVANTSVAITYTAPGALTINAATAPDGEVGLPYSFTVSTSGASGPVTFSLTTVGNCGGGTFIPCGPMSELPDGLSLNTSTGEISGTPTTAVDSQQVRILASDGVATAQRLYSIYINPYGYSAPPMVMHPDTLSNGETGAAYSVTFTADNEVGGLASVWLTGTDTDIPGLSLNDTTGELSGTPSVAGVYSFTVNILDGALRLVHKDYTLTITDPVPTPGPTDTPPDPTPTPTPDPTPTPTPTPVPTPDPVSEPSVVVPTPIVASNPQYQIAGRQPTRSTNTTFTTLQATLRSTPLWVAKSFPYLLFLLLLLLILLEVYQTHQEVRSMQRLRYLIERQKQLAKDKQTFLQLVAHYLRTPLTLVKAGVDLATTKLGADAKRELTALSAAVGASVEQVIGEAEQLETQLPSIPDTEEVPPVFYKQPSFWLPLAAVAFVTIVANVLYATVAGYNLGVVNLMIQAASLAIIAQLFYSVVRHSLQKQRERRKAQALLSYEQQLDTARNDVIYTSRNLLGTQMLSFEQAARRDVPDPKVQAMIAKGTDRFDKVLTEFDLLGGLGTGEVAAKLAPVDLGALCGELSQQFQAPAAAKKLTIQVYGAEGLQVTTDKSLLRNALAALLDNAISYSPEGGHVVLSCQPSGGKVAISVVDNGPGIPKERLHDLFKPFNQLEGVETFNRQGMGLSLYLNRLVMRYLGGDVTAYSKPGAGTTMTVVL